jgi:hypothetical protein
MKRKIFRIFDLSFLSLLTLITGIASIKLGMHYATAGYYLSFTHLFVMIAILRWGYPGIWVSMVAIIPDLLFNNAMLQLGLYLVLANLGLCILIYISKKIGFSKINQQTSLLIGFAIGYFISLILFRGIFSFLIGLPFLSAVIQSMNYMLFSMVMSLIALLMAKSIEGLLLDMNTNMSRGDI